MRTLAAVVDGEIRKHVDKVGAGGVWYNGETMQNPMILDRRVSAVRSEVIPSGDGPTLAVHCLLDPPGDGDVAPWILAKTVMYGRAPAVPVRRQTLSDIHAKFDKVPGKWVECLRKRYEAISPPPTVGGNFNLDWEAWLPGPTLVRAYQSLDDKYPKTVHAVLSGFVSCDASWTIASQSDILGLLLDVASKGGGMCHPQLAPKPSGPVMGFPGFCLKVLPNHPGLPLNVVAGTKPGYHDGATVVVVHGGTLAKDLYITKPAESRQGSSWVNPRHVDNNTVTGRDLVKLLGGVPSHDYHAGYILPMGGCPEKALAHWKGRAFCGTL